MRQQNPKSPPRPNQPRSALESPLPTFVLGILHLLLHHWSPLHATTTQKITFQLKTPSNSPIASYSIIEERERKKF